MNYKELQQIAKEVGAVIDVLMLGRHDNTVFTTGELERFAAIIEKRTIERCAGVCKTLDRKEKLHAAGYGPGYLTYTASDCEQIIRALPTGHIKLEELL